MLDFYPLVRPLLFQLDPERTHGLVIKALKAGLFPAAAPVNDPVLNTAVCGLSFAHPLGMAAGFDKHVEVIAPILRLGFSFTEVGGITPRPQPGNPKPRLFRVTEAEAIINRFGFNNDGTDVCVGRLRHYRETGGRGTVGINITINKDTTDPIMDYVINLRGFAPLADFLVVNVSSPNTAGLRNLQGRDQLNNLLQHVCEAHQAEVRKPPLFVKIAPDLDEGQMEDIATVVLSNKIDGLIVSNTTISRPDVVPAWYAAEVGGLSGRPLFEPSTRILARMYQLTEGKLPLIGVGGIGSGADAYAKICAGASLLQLYSALVYQGPRVVTRILRDLAQLLRRDGYAHVADAVGSRVKDWA
ncbi:MAG: quinone-dependent dihydroorotate dehydrogenase [Alphaproteobacteria bacterium]|nr:quinone-dependent dihydroorotate dehydrogenase [Alphaproteobacteria bacterium]MBV8548973.1 quinone-dependent dihydroorotate dehydrogenase [Alphaproteobacteria bacterium]